MISSIHFENFGVLPTLDFQNPSRINLIIGENGTGKTFFLKVLYAAVKTMEDFHRGDNIRTVTDILSERLRWTFQVDRLGDLVSRASHDNLSFAMELDSQQFGYTFTHSAASKVGTAVSPKSGREANSVFIPAKEVLSLYQVILKSRDVDQSFEFDDTYYDLAKALRISPKKGKNNAAFSKSRKSLQNIINGRVDFDERTGRWFYRDKSNFKFAIGATSEGIRKISIIDRLLLNGYLDSRSIIFIDDAESGLHPDAVCQLLDVVDGLADRTDLQFFIASHSYFVLKKLALIAMRKADFVTCVSLHKDRSMEFHDLHDGMPNNSIVDASIQLYEQEIAESLQWQEPADPI